MKVIQNRHMVVHAIHEIHQKKWNISTSVFTVYCIYILYYVLFRGLHPANVMCGALAYSCGRFFHMESVFIKVM